jgi:signal transduction histidine kinase
MDSTRTLLDAALLFGSTRNLEQLLKLVLARMVSLMGAERALFGIFDAQGEIEYAETHNLQWRGPGTPLPISNKTIQQVRESQESCSVTDTNEDTVLSKHESIRLHNLRFILAMPVRACDRVAGVLYADSSAPALHLARQQTDLLRGLADFVGIALENVLLLQEQRLRTALLDQLVHDLRTPLQVVHSNAEWLGTGTATESDLRETARDIEASAQKMSHMIAVNRQLSMVDAGVTATAPAVLNISEALRSQARVQRIVAREYGLQFHVDLPDTLPLVTTYADRFDIALDNLVFNALKHARAGSSIGLSARVRADAGPREALERPLGTTAVLFQRVPAVLSADSQGYVEVCVHNHGAPIPENLHARLFDAWTHGGTGREKPSGLGLSIVHQCVRSLGGAVWAVSDEHEGTRFLFTVPVVARVVFRAASKFPTGPMSGA